MAEVLAFEASSRILDRPIVSLSLVHTERVLGRDSALGRIVVTREHEG